MFKLQPKGKSHTVQCPSVVLVKVSHFSKTLETIKFRTDVFDGAFWNM